LKFIHVSDLHLCSGFVSTSLSPEIADAHRAQLWKTFQDIIGLCRDESVDVLLVSGDLFESAYSRISDIKSISDIFASIPDTRIFISPGNHDCINNSSYYNIVQFPPNTHVFRKYEEVHIPELNCSVHGFGWDKNRFKEMPFAFGEIDSSRINILCLHCDIFTQSDYLPINRNDLAMVGFDYCALGHIHKAQQLGQNIFYSGSPEPLNFGEEGQHGFVRGTFDENKKASLTFSSANHREFVTLHIKIDAEMDMDFIKNEILKSCQETMSKDIFRIIFTGIAHPHISIENVMLELKDDFYSLDYYDRTVPDYDIKKIYQDNKDNIVGKFIYSLTQDATKDPIAYKALLSGLEALLYGQEDN